MSACLEFELFGDVLAHKQRCRHPIGGNSVRPRRLVLALLLVFLRHARIGHQTFLFFVFGSTTSR